MKIDVRDSIKIEIATKKARHRPFYNEIGEIFEEMLIAVENG